MAGDAASRRRAQRAIARELAQERRGRGKYTLRTGSAARTAGRHRTEQYLDEMLRHPERLQNTTTLEKRQLARAASLAMHGKANPAYYDAWHELFYHNADPRDENVGYGEG